MTHTIDTTVLLVCFASYCMLGIVMCITNKKQLIVTLIIIDTTHGNCII